MLYLSESVIVNARETAINDVVYTFYTSDDENDDVTFASYCEQSPCSFSVLSSKNTKVHLYSRFKPPHLFTTNKENLDQACLEISIINNVDCFFHLQIHKYPVRQIA